MQASIPNYGKLLQDLRDLRQQLHSYASGDQHITGLISLEASLSEVIAQLETLAGLGEAIGDMKADAHESANEINSSDGLSQVPRS